ncbi:amidohydrolase family protein [Roseomonas sp. E05]|uniref:amidohydrolase family protein n=1 Tax=Roseomonas sp. E05 TaxID=3046310 RepID=UPI0024BA9D1B|nr:amidohydrolase family protein [Roseomonas sp. E05]MDJ0391112.1 amidohydrolase family protein [Roseomonas sp. E05]
MIIDCHAHLVPPPLLEEVRGRAAEFPSLRLVESGPGFGFSFAGSKPTRPVGKPLLDIAARREWMAKQGIDRQVVGGWLDMYGYELPAKEGAAWSRLINRHLVAAAEADRHFVPLGTVPLQDGAAAAEVLEEAMAAGCPGVMIGTQPKGTGGVLDDPALAPFWEAADRLKAVVFIHPVFESGDDRVHDYGMANAVGRVTDTMIAVARLLYAGHPLRYARARIVASVGGAGLPMVLGRLKRNHALDASLADPEANLRALWFDTILHDPRALRFAAEVVGAERLMLGSDMPFPIGDLAPRAIIAAAGFEGAERAAMETGTAAALFRIG